MTFLKRLCGAAALAGAMAVTQLPAEAQQANAMHPAAASPKVETATHAAVRQIKSSHPRKRRCTG